MSQSYLTKTTYFLKDDDLPDPCVENLKSRCEGDCPHFRATNIHRDSWWPWFYGDIFLVRIIFVSWSFLEKKNCAYTKVIAISFVKVHWKSQGHGHSDILVWCVWRLEISKESKVQYNHGTTKTKVWLPREGKFCSWASVNASLVVW